VKNDDLVVLRREGSTRFHYVLITAADAMCTCPGFERWGHCWAVDAARELKNMTREISTAVVVQPATLPTPDEMRTMDILAAQLIEQDTIAVPENLRTKAEVFAVIFAGWENGVQPMTALRHVAVVNGKTEPDAQLMVAICMTKEPDITFEVMREDDATSIVRLTRPSKGFVKEFEYAQTMAVQAGLANKGAWSSHPRVMRQWAAVKRLARMYCADLINGVRVVVQTDDAVALPRPANMPLPPHDPDIIDGEFKPADTDDDGTDSVSEPAPEAPSSSVEPPPLAEPVIDVALASDDQIATITDYYDAIRDRHGGDSLVRFQDAARERWPYAAQDGGVFQARKLTASDADALVGLLKATLETRDGNPPSSSGLL
jgi:hypothetical protein